MLPIDRRTNNRWTDRTNTELYLYQQAAYATLYMTVTQSTDYKKSANLTWCWQGSGPSHVLCCHTAEYLPSSCLQMHRSGALGLQDFPI